MQLLSGYLLIAFAGAIVMLFMLILLGAAVGYGDEIRRRRIDIYARVIGTPLLLLAAVYLYLQGALSPDILFVAIVWLLPVVLCTDWTRLRRTKSEQEKT